MFGICTCVRLVGFQNVVVQRVCSPRIAHSLASNFCKNSRHLIWTQAGCVVTTWNRGAASPPRLGRRLKLRPAPLLTFDARVAAMTRHLESKFALVVENLAPVTRSADVRYECEYFGPVRRCERDRDLRVCLVEFDRAADAHAAWIKMDGLRMDGRRWKVNYADELDFKHFDWAWFEQARRRSRTRSRSYSRSPTRD
eukprot:jgi/Ulvmu1/5411/UM022_0206.1